MIASILSFFSTIVCFYSSILSTTLELSKYLALHVAYLVEYGDELNFKRLGQVLLKLVHEELDDRPESKLHHVGKHIGQLMRGLVRLELRGFLQQLNEDFLVKLVPLLFFLVLVFGLFHG